MGRMAKVCFELFIFKCSLYLLPNSEINFYFYEVVLEI